MTIVFTRSFLVLGLSLLALAQQNYSESLDYPAPVRGTTVDDYQGTPVPDRYRGREDLDSAATRAWLDAQPRVALDPNSQSKDGSLAVVDYVASQDGRLLATEYPCRDPTGLIRPRYLVWTGPSGGDPLHRRRSSRPQTSMRSLLIDSAFDRISLEVEPTPIEVRIGNNRMIRLRSQLSPWGHISNGNCRFASRSRVLGSRQSTLINESQRSNV